MAPGDGGEDPSEDTDALPRPPDEQAQEPAGSARCTQPSASENPVRPEAQEEN